MPRTLGRSRLTYDALVAELAREKKRRQKVEAENRRLETRVASLELQPSPWVEIAALLLIPIFEALYVTASEIYRLPLVAANILLLMAIGYNALRSWLKKPKQ